MGKIILITGPARSGKSEWAETLAMESGKGVVYVATATDNTDDQEWHQRILEHQQRRPEDWVTLSVPIELSATLADAKPYNCLLVDSLGTWVANLLEEDESSWENIVVELLETVDLVAADVLFVAEEVGWGVVPAYPLGRMFRDRLGSLVRQLAALSETVYLVTGGHVLNLSVLGSPLPAREDAGVFKSQDS
ncbi:bifunctional adenosylcobinamide kinase/adenosylcobinamide-phosphate guanylyltransferase [Nostoc sp. UCD121]|uniref:bifunctional adenosylcobinamide kinase/adenosylcobinamide-phosphate guanylyltransferase n=1 Tax=unclassified Nostoc TaxID=2593658 RepID=UPI001625BDAA|nr:MULTISPECIES: bifunctional adenosylcobinamide kinase/adenosylcobinamide-phosphate guanylyltransferase [unclassified Nostoc]MBC1222689.1 bifunctional adenosylcobinamide kinase/adenosylcobinamide-phosphate guanylyltransferase [Nostoc sp. UCD120]MBC1274742.1 bifunctional adenosylcobinamide kinase/adenosylcobinamide-phosphate guanylyltransferase [Nostoc sp. UCD121]MBC1297703.1 bifunctional adenosylcobinamide kinase/adenosylcobinamide-phosphate guanylyltransferase [Nostoc sp. UCD122]